MIQSQKTCLNDASRNSTSDRGGIISDEQMFISILSLLTNRLRGFLHGAAYFCEMYQIDNESEMGQLITSVSGRSTGGFWLGLLESLSQEYIRAARARGIAEWRILSKHARLAALLPVVTVFGMSMGPGFPNKGFYP